MVVLKDLLVLEDPLPRGERWFGDFSHPAISKKALIQM